MPKKIDGLREKIILIAQKKLLEEDYGSFSLREVARECGIAVGTIYNYFPDKDTLSAFAISQSWTEVLEKMDHYVEQAESIQEGIEGICQCICEFNDRYRNVWSNFRNCMHPAVCMKKLVFCALLPNNVFWHLQIIPTGKKI